MANDQHITDQDIQDIEDNVREHGLHLLRPRLLALRERVFNTHIDPHLVRVQRLEEELAPHQCVIDQERALREEAVGLLTGAQEAAREAERARDALAIQLTDERARAGAHAEIASTLRAQLDIAQGKREEAERLLERAEETIEGLRTEARNEQERGLE